MDKIKVSQSVVPYIVNYLLMLLALLYHSSMNISSSAVAAPTMSMVPKLSPYDMSIYRVFLNDGKTKADSPSIRKYISSTESPS